MDIQSVINGRLGVGFGHLMGRVIPPGIGNPLASSLGGIVSRRNHLPMVQAVRANQWVVGDCRLSSPELNRLVENTFRNTALSIYTFARLLNDPSAMNEMVEIPDQLIELFTKAISTKRGFMIAGIHLGNFDLALVAALTKIGQLPGIRGLAITVPEIHQGYELQNKFRSRDNFTIIPGSIEAIRLAGEYLEDGGIVVTGIDRPMSHTRKLRPIFFSRPSNLPVLHITIALRYKAPILIVGLQKKLNGIYKVQLSELIAMKPNQNRHAELIYNAEAVLERAEGMIRESPEQWAMFYPVWPEALSEVPTT